jgi:hypothetical protein
MLRTLYWAEVERGLPFEGGDGAYSGNNFEIPVPNATVSSEYDTISIIVLLKRDINYWTTLNNRE